MAAPGRIFILCGTLEPGKDGVGDYSRQLATALVGRGHAVRLVASHDKFAGGILEESVPSGESTVSITRIPYAQPAAERLRMLRSIIEAFRPDWLSLQYVPYSFNSRGVPLAFGALLRKLRHYGEWQVMFHELWIDQRGLATPKASAISALQRLAVLRVVRALRPAVCHTHLPGYQVKLRTLRIETVPLPLFANIIAPASAPPLRVAADGPFRLGFFSQMELLPEVMTFIKALSEWLTSSEKRALELVLLGGGKEKINATATGLRERFPQITVDPVGFLSAEALSQRLRLLDLGITPVRYHAVGKSGTVAAFLSHGIPVAAPWRTEQTESFFDPTFTAAIIETFSPKALQKATAAARTLDFTGITLAGVTDRFLEDLALHP